MGQYPNVNKYWTSSTHLRLHSRAATFQGLKEKAMNEKQEASSGSIGRAIRWPIVLVGMMLAMSVSFMPRASAQGDDADKILKAMSDYVASQKTLSVTFDSDIEVITPICKNPVHQLGPGAIEPSGQASCHPHGRLFGRGDRLRWQDAHREQQGRQRLRTSRLSRSVDQFIDELRENTGSPHQAPIFCSPSPSR